MSSDIEKLAVMDSRIVQQRPKYAVEKGALSLTNAPFNAISQSASQHTYNIYVPSENVFVDRKLQWSSTCQLQMTVAVTIPTLSLPLRNGTSFVVIGRDLALATLPLNQLCSTMSATINDTTAVINSQDVLNPILRLTDYKKNRLIRTAPTMLDKYQNYDDAFLTVNNPIGGYEVATDYDNVPNGSFPGLFWTNPAGGVYPLLPSSPAYGASSSYSAAKWDAVSGVPVWNQALADNGGALGSGGVVSGAYTVYTFVMNVAFRSTEPLCLSPFIFADEHEWDTGLFGINNIQLIMNLQSSPSRVLRSSTRGGVTISNVAYNPTGAFVNSFLNTLFLTPSLDVPLPPKSVVPYMEFPRYITSFQTQQAIAPYTSGQLQSQTITLPQIPDLLIIYAKSPLAEYQKNVYGDFYFPVASRLTGGNANPLSVNFDNFSGLLSSTTTEQLYGMSVKNGLDMDYATWLGMGHSSSASWSSPVLYNSAVPPVAIAGSGLTGYQGSLVPTNGGPLVLKPSQDITLQSGQAPSLVGNFTLQFNLTVYNNTPVSQQPVLYVITANSGFFESIRGSSRIIKGVLSEQDIIGAPLAPMATRSELDRMVGGASFKSLGNILSKCGKMGSDGSHAKSASAEPSMGRGGAKPSGRSLASRLL